MGHFEVEPKYTQVMLLEQTAEGGWSLMEDAVSGYTTQTYSTTNRWREASEGSDKSDESSSGATKRMNE